MSSFLLNLARRAAGLPVSSIQARTPAPPGADVPALDLDAGEAAMEAPAPRRESSTVTPAVTRAIDEALPHPAIQRFPAMAESPPSPPTMPMAAEACQVAETPAPARTVEPTGQYEPVPLTESTALAAMPAPRPPVPPQTEREPARRAAPHPIAEPSMAAVVSDLEPAPFSHDVPDVIAWRERRSLASVAASVVPGQGGLPTIAPIATPGDPPRTTPVIRPAAADSPAPLRFAGPAAASPTRTTPPPVHVRIGRVEVRGAPTPAPRQPSSPGAPPTLGFAGYTRVRMYRNWPR